MYQQEDKMRDPEMYNYVRQVLETMREYNLDLDRALGMHGHNMTRAEVRDTIADSPPLQRLSDEVSQTTHGRGLSDVGR